MSESEKFFLQWNEFQNNVGTSYRELRRSGQFSDVTLASEDGHKVPCHKVVLCSSSPHLSSLLSSPHPSPIVLPGIKIQLLKTILDFIYHGEVEVEKPDLYSFLAVGEKLQLKGLVKPTREKEETAAPKVKEETAALKVKEETAAPKVKEEMVATKEKAEIDSLTKEKIKSKTEVTTSDGEYVFSFIEKKGKVWTCIKCGKTASTWNGRSNLKKHVLIHQDEKVFPCITCGKESKTQNGLSQHIVKHHSGVKVSSIGQEQLVVDIAEDGGETVAAAEEYEDALEEIEEEVEETYKEEKPIVDSSVGSLVNKTARDEEWKEKVNALIEKFGAFWRCVECGKTAEDSKDRYKLKAHVETHLAGIVHTCQLCGHNSSTSTALGRHKYKNHKEELQRIMKAVMKYKCKFCGNGSRSRKGLERHRYKNHKNEPKPKVEDEEKPFKCNICGKGSRSKKGLEGHTYKNHKNELKPKVEEDDKPFKCNVCGKGSISTRGREGHMYKRHRAKTYVEGKYKCSVCDKGSKTAKGREQHKYKYHHKNGRYFGEKTENRSLTGSQDKFVTTKEESYEEVHQEALAEDIGVQIERMKEEVERLKEQTKDISLDELESDQEENMSEEDNVQLEDKLLEEDNIQEKDRLVEEDVMLEEDVNLEEDSLLEENTIPVEADKSPVTEVGDSESSSLPSSSLSILELGELHQKSVSLCLREGDTWSCTKCGRKAEDKYKHNLFRHAEVHLEGLTFPCNECGNISRSSNGLYQHKAKAHSKGAVVSPYNCTICGRGSKTSKGLEIHKYKYHKAGVQAAQ